MQHGVLHSWVEHLYVAPSKPNVLAIGAAVPPYMDWRHNLREAFQPGRWLKPAAERPKCFFTFGLGVHSCMCIRVLCLLYVLAVHLSAGSNWWHRVS